MAFLPICRYADIGDCRYADIIRIQIHRKKGWIWIQILTLFHSQGTILANMSQNADIQISAISALKMFADSLYADIEKSADMPILPI